MPVARSMGSLGRGVAVVWANVAMGGRFFRRPLSGLYTEMACLAIRSCIGCALIIRLIIQTILLDPSGAIWTDGPSNVSRLDPSGAV
jgi:hypothetical protein